jgi:capsular exopolysaccharide synthesis family protein
MKQNLDPFTEVPAGPSGRTSQLSSLASDAFQPSSHGGWMPPEEGFVDLAMRVLRRRKWIVLQALVIVPVIALLYSLHQPTLYTTSAGLLFQNPAQTAISPDSADLADATAVSATNNSLISLPIVSTYASRELGGRISAGEIKSSVSVSNNDSSGSNVTEISAQSGSPTRAAAIANAYGAGYIAFSKQSAQTAYASSIRQVQANLTALPTTSASSSQRRELTSELGALQNAEATNNGGAVLVQPATAPHSKSSPKTSRNVILGVIVGGLLGILLAALLDRLDHRINDGEEFERIYGLPILTEIPRTRELARGQMPFDVAERFRALRTSLRYVNLDGRAYTLLVASPSPQDGKSTVARSLAMTMARMGDNVVLVDVDLHKTSDRYRNGGLAGVLIGDDLGDALVHEPLTPEAGRYLTVLPAGPVPPPNPSELLESPRMSEVITQLEGMFDLIIFDAPALGNVSDGLSLIPSVSGVLIVGALGHTTTKSAMALRRQIALLHGHPVGLVVNYTSRIRSKYAYGYGDAS